VFYATSNNGVCEALFSTPMTDFFSADSKALSHRASMHETPRSDGHGAHINSETVRDTRTMSGGAPNRHSRSSEAFLRDFPDEIDEG